VHGRQKALVTIGQTTVTLACLRVLHAQELSVKHGYAVRPPVRRRLNSTCNTLFGNIFQLSGPEHFLRAEKISSFLAATAQILCQL